MSLGFILYALQRVFMLFLGVGVVLFVLWANKLKPAALRPLMMKCLTTGVIGLVLSALFMGYAGMDMGIRGKKGMHDWKADMMQEGKMMGEKGGQSSALSVEVMSGEASTTAESALSIEVLESVTQ